MLVSEDKKLIRDSAQVPFNNLCVSHGGKKVNYFQYETVVGRSRIIIILLKAKFRTEPPMCHDYWNSFSLDDVMKLIIELTIFYHIQNLISDDVVTD